MRKMFAVAVMALMIVPGCGQDVSDTGRVGGRDDGRLFPVPAIEYAPEHYICYRTETPIVIDGRMDDPMWQRAAETDLFVDIEGDLRPAPRFRTRAKMLWDSTYFYIAADMQEPHVWGALTERDAVIYHDNDFEVFIDPDGDTHEYYELEVNALNTQWDLFLVKPYRDGAPAINAWDIQGLRTAVYVDGTVNNPTDIDSGWSIEIAIPWSVLKECAHRDTPPREGDQWRVNFSRVEWRAEAVDGKYVKLVDSATGKNLPEDNWVWSPQGLIAMHYPEMWGIVQFSENLAGTPAVAFSAYPDEEARWAMRRLYYAEREFREKYGGFSTTVSILGLDGIELEGWQWPPIIKVTESLFEARLDGTDSKKVLIITGDGRIRTESRE